ncbi:uncharacterized protein LOC34621592 [Cyclospora cayetanensis]|uniref:Uncharacterized protein LOC34621592 n=1 Tax=Cyclospora cayetanensis TaxID=88456 RepID=A0A6P6RSI3_9EIME|nr:uncharacterized protein LOC34621592 [Cyclospora cayetanensis]
MKLTNGEVSAFLARTILLHQLCKCGCAAALLRVIGARVHVYYAYRLASDLSSCPLITSLTLLLQLANAERRLEAELHALSERLKALQQQHELRQQQQERRANELQKQLAEQVSKAAEELRAQQQKLHLQEEVNDLSYLRGPQQQEYEQGLRQELNELREQRKAVDRTSVECFQSLKEEQQEQRVQQQEVLKGQQALAAQLNQIQLQQQRLEMVQEQRQQLQEQRQHHDDKVKWRLEDELNRLRRSVNPENRRNLTFSKVGVRYPAKKSTTPMMARALKGQQHEKDLVSETSGAGAVPLARGVVKPSVQGIHRGSTGDYLLGRTCEATRVPANTLPLLCLFRTTRHQTIRAGTIDMGGPREESSVAAVVAVDAAASYAEKMRKDIVRKAIQGASSRRVSTSVNQGPSPPFAALRHDSASPTRTAASGVARGTLQQMMQHQGHPQSGRLLSSLSCLQQAHEAKPASVWGADALRAATVEALMLKARLQVATAELEVLRLKEKRAEKRDAGASSMVDGQSIVQCHTTHSKERRWAAPQDFDQHSRPQTKTGKE